MRFIRKPSVRKVIAARLSIPRFIRHNLGVKMPAPFGLLTNPKKAIYNRIYTRLTVSFWSILASLFK